MSTSGLGGLVTKGMASSMMFMEVNSVFFFLLVTSGAMKTSVHRRAQQVGEKPPKWGEFGGHAPNHTFYDKMHLTTTLNTTKFATQVDSSIITIVLQYYQSKSNL